MNINENGCTFCNEFNGHSELSYFKNNYGEKIGINNRCVLESDLFVCVPSIGSFVPGYILVIPRAHFLSFLGMPNFYLRECQDILNLLKNHYCQHYKSHFILYEHGTANEKNQGGMSVLHAHFHLLPCNVKMIKFCSEFQFAAFSCLSDVVNYYRAVGDNRPYLLLRDSDAVWYLAFSQSIPSQFFRKRICDVLGKPGMGDWKNHPFIENINMTIANAQQYGLQKMFRSVVKDGESTNL